MGLLHRVSLAAALLAMPALAAADDDAVVAEPPPQPAPPSPPPPEAAPVPPPEAQQPPAQQPPAPAPAVKKTTIGADLTFVLPLGDYADGADVGVGGLLRIEYAATPELAVTLRGGYLWHKTPSDDSGLGMVPVLLGGVYRFHGGPFAYGELGINMIRVSTTFMGITATDGETYLSFGAGGGYAVGKVSGRLGFWMPGRPKSLDETTTLFGVVASVGFDFNAF
jgi:hypothetical protein